MDAKTVIKKLEAKGWQVLRQKGSHAQMGKGSRRTTIPVHGKRDLKIGTLRSIEKQTGEKLQ